MRSNHLVTPATYADYLKWDDDRRYELIDFVPYLMSAPTVEHQRIVGRIFRKIADHLDGKNCEPFISPFDLRLAESSLGYDKIGNVVQPDITVICDKSGLDERGYSGAPALIIEVVSPSSAKMDRWFKYNAYERQGVKEYWIVIPNEQVVETHVLQDGKYKLAGVYGLDDVIPSVAVEGLEVSVHSVF